MSQDPRSERENRARIERYKNKVEALYQSALEEFANLVNAIGFDPEKPFSFADYPATRKRLNEYLQNYASSLKVIIDKGTTEAWYAAMKKADTKLPAKNIYNARSREALKEFQERVEGGLKLSDRVWNYSGQLKEEIELALSTGIQAGTSAKQLAKDLKYALKEPDNLFRRVRDKHGVLQLSKRAKAYKPGQGVYRSSYQNALRLTANEINVSYRSADHNRWKNDKSVIGIEVKLSNRHKVRDICDDLKGKYPKDFKYTGWHVRCLCYVVPVVINDDDFEKLLDDEAGIAPLPDNFKPAGQITDVPEGFKNWVKDNEARVNGWKSQPAFIKDNFKDGKISGGLKIETQKAGKQVKTQQQIEDIQNRWNARKESKKLDPIIRFLEKSKIDFKEVGLLPKTLSEADIITRVGGGDLTKGSCSSLAFVYAGNKAGLDVLDFRDGNSRSVFSALTTIKNITERVGGIVAKNASDFTNAADLLKNVVEGKEYYFTCGQHAAIVRKTTEGFEYLELQSSNNNGFKPLTTESLKNRFGAKRSHTFSGMKYEKSDCLIDLDLLKRNPAFKKMLGYINTAEDKQKKGIRGYMR